MKKIILLAIILVGSFMSNPTKKDFEIFVKEHIEERAAESVGETEFGALLGGLFSGFGAAAVDKMTVRKDFYIASLYTVKMDKRDYKYLGLFSKFIPLQLESPLESDKE